MSNATAPVTLIADARPLGAPANDNADPRREERSARIRELEQSIRARLGR